MKNVQEARTGDPKAPKPKIFVSYFHEDIQKAKFVKEVLLPEFELHIDFSRLFGGQEFEERIKALIADADSLVFLVTKKSLESHWCSIEVGFAHALQKKIVPLVLDEEVIGTLRERPILSNLHFIKWTKTEIVRQALISAISPEKAMVEIVPHFVGKHRDSFLFSYIIENNSTVEMFDLKISTMVCAPLRGRETGPNYIDRAIVKTCLNLQGGSYYQTAFHPSNIPDSDVDKSQICAAISEHWLNWDENFLLEVLVTFTFQSQARRYHRYRTLLLKEFDLNETIEL